MESLDYVGGHKITVNSLDAKRLPSGRYVIIVAHKDPGIPDTNWIDTCGGFLCPETQCLCTIAMTFELCRPLAR